MQAELYCTHCHCHFTAPDAPAAEQLVRAKSVAAMTATVFRGRLFIVFLSVGPLLYVGA